MSNQNPERRAVQLVKPLKIIRRNGQAVCFPIGTIFYNFGHSPDKWEAWFYEYKISCGIGLKLEPREYVPVGKGVKIAG